jgi:hypothetical protein
MTTLETICIINNDQINNNILEVSNNTLNVKKTSKVIKFDEIIKINSTNDSIIKNDIYSTVGNKKNTTYFLLGKKNEEKLILNIITDMIIEYSLLNIPFNIYIHEIDFHSICDLLRAEDININDGDFDGTKLHINPLNKIEVDDTLKLVISCIMNKKNSLSKIIFSIENEYQRIAVYDLLEDKGTSIFLHENYYINTELYYIELYFLKTDKSILKNSKLVTLLNNEMNNNCKFILNYVNEHKFISVFEALINYYQKASHKVVIPSAIPSKQIVTIIPPPMPLTIPVAKKYNIEDDKKLLTQLSIYNRCLFDNTVKYHIKIQKAKNSVELYESFDEIKDEMCITLKIILDKLRDL